MTGFVVIRSQTRLSPHLAGDGVALGLVGTETLLATVLPVRAPGTRLVTVLSPPPGPAVTQSALSLAPGVILSKEFISFSSALIIIRIFIITIKNWGGK